MPLPSPYCITKSLQIFSIKGQIVNLGLTGHLVSVIITYLGHYTVKVVTVNGCGYMPVTFICEQNADWIWPHRLFAPVDII